MTSSLQTVLYAETAERTESKGGTVLNTQNEVLKRNIDNMILQENQDGLNGQEKFIMQKLIKDKMQMEHETKLDLGEEADADNGK